MCRSVLILAAAPLVACLGNHLRPIAARVDWRAFDPLLLDTNSGGPNMLYRYLRQRLRQAVEGETQAFAAITTREQGEALRRERLAHLRRALGELPLRPSRPHPTPSSPAVACVRTRCGIPPICTSHMRPSCLV